MWRYIFIDDDYDDHKDVWRKNYYENLKDVQKT